MIQPPTLSEMTQSLEVDEALEHASAGPTIQDVFDAMSTEKKDLIATIVGAALENTNLSGNDDVISDYNALSDEHKALVEFTVGNLLADDTVLKHDDMWESESLEHFGVKGMKWGVIRDTATGGPGRLSASSANTSAGRAKASANVTGGRPSVKDTHLASLKSNGHRAINALSGDKTFWSRMAVTVGITTAAIAVPVAGAWLLPAGVLSAIGGSSVGAALAGVGSTAIGTGGMTTAQVGGWALASVGFNTAVATAAVGTVGNVVGNTARAVAGNTLINKSYAAKMGKTLKARQTEGRRRVNAVLKASAGIRDKDLLKHDDIQPPTVTEMAHILETTEDVLVHFGIKGMKWGIRRTDSELAAVRVNNSDGTEAGSISPSSKAAGAAIRKMSVGSSMVVDDPETGQPMTLTKQADGSLTKVPLSADAERFIKTLAKTPEQMSDAELKAATNRAQQLQSYNKLFGGDNKSELARQVEQLEMQKKYVELQRALNPPKASAVQKLVKGSAKGFETFKQVDKILNGNLSDAISSSLGLKPPMSAVDILKLDNEITSLRTKNINLKAEFNKTAAKKGRDARGDLPSLAKDYKDAGKRRARDKGEGKRQRADGYKYTFPA